MVAVEQVIEQIENFRDGKVTDMQALNNLFNAYMQNDVTYRKDNAQILITKVKECMVTEKPFIKTFYYYLFSFAFRATRSIEMYKEFLRSCMNDTSLTKENRFFLYNQCVRINFLEADLVDNEIRALMDELYTNVLGLFLSEVQEDLCYISKEDRNKDLVVVLSTQVLNVGHAPTKTLIDRCAVLERVLHKNVFIINTAEFVSLYGMVHFFQTFQPTYIEQYSNMSTLPIANYEFSYFQCPNQMPQVPIIREIIDVIKSEKPYFILTIGGNSIVSDICSKIVPTITIGTVFSGRAVTRGQFQTIGRRINDYDREWLSCNGYDEEHIIESLFTFVFKEQQHTYTREHLGFPKDRFVVALIGARLGDEVDDTCTKLLLRLIEKGAFITFVGCFDAYEQYIKKYPLMANNSNYLGFQDDVLAVLENCDLYINPKRNGGGSSAAEALYKGVSVVSMNYGDVAVAVGPEFSVSDWDEMYEKCVQYMDDKDYYEKMSQKAKERAVLLTDSDTAFVKIIEEAEKRKGFQ